MTAFADQNQFDSVLQVFAPDGVTLIESDDNQGSFGSTASSIAGTPLPSTGTYFLRVSGSGTSTQLRPYHLHFQLRHGAPTPETEPGTAPLPPSGWVAGILAADNDHFTLPLNAGDTVFVGLDLDPERDGSWSGAVGLRPFLGFTR